MKPEEQRIAIAKACGWTRIEGRKGLPPGKTSHAPSLALSDSDDGWLFLPDYLNDLNAMHEAEKVLSNEQAFTMREHAWSIASFKDGKCGHASRDEQGRNCYNATAAQRAEAFLRTLNLYIP